MWIVYNYLPKGRGRVYNYPTKGRWIVVTDIPRREASRDLSSAIYLALWTNPEGDNCFSIYQISWRKIKKELFVKKRCHFVTICFRFNWQCFRDHFLWFRCKLTTSQILPLSWYLLAQLLHLPLQFHLSKLSRNEKLFWILSQNSEYPRIFRVTGANQDLRKFLSTAWFGEN